ncbi:M28 family peptidase [Desertivirga xinjiangensis]|uniref:M28 family peptidase n=1 Tax=Desertivirga xinjiangensis TaxID=539206 RepID=UPI00210D9DDC|nr:M28 family peptidase [Pedobacter xinjiangensis]
MKLQLGSCFFALSLAFLGFAQQNPEALRYSRLIDTATSYKHLSILASDEFEGRETGKPGATKAANYLAGEFKKLGLKAPVNNSWFQNVDLIENSLTVKRFTVNGKPLEHLHDFYIKGFLGSFKVDVKEVVFAGYGISNEKYNDYAGVDIRGKVVMLIAKGEPVKAGKSVITGRTELSDWSNSLNKRVDALKLKKPALILLIKEELNASLKISRAHLEKPSIAINRSAKEVQTEVPVVSITAETADKFLAPSKTTLQQLKSLIAKTGTPASKVVMSRFAASFLSQNSKIPAVNVLGYLEGSDLKDELVVVSAHYDHVGLNPGGADTVFNGADDDGSGTTAVLEMAEAFTAAKKDGKGPRRSMLFLLVVGEEKGLLGSEWYSDHPVFPLKNTVANLNIDMIGRVDPAHKNKADYCYLIGSDKLSTDLHKISERTNATYTKLDIDYKYNAPDDPERIYYRSDHYNFAKHNIPIIFYFNGIHEDYHQPGDEISKIDFPLLVKRAQLVFFTAWDLANRDKRPVVDVRKE